MQALLVSLTGALPRLLPAAGFGALSHAGYRTITLPIAVCRARRECAPKHSLPVVGSILVFPLCQQGKFLFA